uniref:Uncharacterized protein n=1 Tax=Pipistrellus kuhlii TaxID=59472 RepID=A0A7J7WDD8_PIPKU|nr:hypothetical protein mPipKuh1_008093 [Pipistrellus kuhlii]
MSDTGVFAERVQAPMAVARTASRWDSEEPQSYQLPSRLMRAWGVGSKVSFWLRYKTEPVRSSPEPPHLQPASRLQEKNVPPKHPQIPRTRLISESTGVRGQGGAESSVSKKAGPGRCARRLEL